MSDGDFIKGLGSRTDVIHAIPEAARRPLSAEERALLAEAGAGATVGEVLSRSGLPEARGVATLLGLRLQGLVRPGWRPASSPVGGAPSRPSSGAIPVVDVAALREDVEIEPARRQEILEFEARCASPDHFAMLGVPRGAPAAECKKAYYELTRRFHPDRYFGKRLGSYKARIDKVFKRMTEAQLVLTDPNRRAEWLAAHPQFAAPGRAQPATPLDEARLQERRERIARHPYLARRHRLNELLTRAREAMGKREFSLAINELNLAMQLQPNHPEVMRMLREARRGADRVRGEAELAAALKCEEMGDVSGALVRLRTAQMLDPENLQISMKLARLLLGLGGQDNLREGHMLMRKAIELEPANVDARLLFASILAQVGMFKNAKREFETVLKQRPGDKVATEQLRKLRWKF